MFSVWGSISDKEIVVNYKYYLIIIFVLGIVFGFGEGNRYGYCLFGV